MDYKKLAELLYPNAKDVSFWEEKYPQRNLSSGAEVVRIAPSPTGYLHIGNFFGAMVDYEIAKTTGGVFYFRLEDTDKKREVDGADFVALNVLKEFGISPDEGLMPNGTEKGNYGPYRQSERLEIYKSYAKKLVLEGKAFPCFCQKAADVGEVFQRREKELQTEASISEKDPCRNLTFEEIEAKLKESKKFALRLKSNGKEGDKVVAFDLCRGEMELPANCKDIVLVKDNGIPPYAFAHVIDDHLMKTTTVVRGSDWLSTWPQHLEIYEALGLKVINYIHTPLISKLGENGNKRKISKRYDPEADMRFYVEMGIPKVAVCEYVLNLANSNFELWRAANPELDFREFKFSPNKIGLSSPLFDMNKLLDISKNYISKLSATEVYSNVLSWAKEFDKDFAKLLEERKDFAISVFNIDREGKNPRKDLEMFSQAKKVFSYMFLDFLGQMKIEDYEIDSKDFAKAKRVVSEYKNVLDEKDDKETWFSKIKALAQKLGFATDNKEFKKNPENFEGNVANFCEFIRVAITGRKNSPDLFTIISILGQEKTVKRLEKLENLL